MNPSDNKTTRPRPPSALRPSALLLALLAACPAPASQPDAAPLNISGIHPHLAFYNDEGECGTGAVVPWAGSLWAVTYGPHEPFGSSDKLYQISPDLKMTIRPESVGGTPANRMLHRESNQLFIGPYAIDRSGQVRVMDYKAMPGRHTGNARHLTDPAGKIYYGTMEEGFYEVDVATLEPTVLYKDGNVLRKPGQMAQHAELLPGAHGKGLYSGQGVLVYANNGEASRAALKKFNIKSGVLAEWDGRDWKVIRRNQFVEVTGPGGIQGNRRPETDPIWATGWDYKSVLLGVRDRGAWTFYRLPKASHSYDGAHGWNTEWPRIRDVGAPGNPDYLMTMHGMFWRFPAGFTPGNAAGIRPRSAYLKVIGDFTRWNDRLVFGCDDSAKREFLNKRKAKGGIEGPGQSNSNLWFTPLGQPDLLGPRTAAGHVWLQEPVKAGAASDPFLFAGWDERRAWLKNAGTQPVVFRFEVDRTGNNKWSELETINVAPGASAFIDFNNDRPGEWIRVTADRDTVASVSFVYTAREKRPASADTLFQGLSGIGDPRFQGGLLYSLGDNRRAMGLLARTETGETGYYEIDERMNLTAKNDAETAAFIREKFAIPRQVVAVDEGSVLIVDDAGRRWRLPLGDARFTAPTLDGSLRVCREVATERDLFNCHGTFYELPAENADGYAKIRPVASHNLRINDYASYRGLLVITGINPGESKGNPHVFVSADRKAAVWAGVIDDLWKLGKPTGRGGPWVNATVRAGQPSDPYLIGFYDRRALRLSHRATTAVTFNVEVDPTGDGDWLVYTRLTVRPGAPLEHTFPPAFQARWLRLVPDTDTTATAWLEYR
ncbi:MAG: hypothetical protein LBI02_11155 [Opitutaceae bacterium]|jgi:hypothetical protein|nr:hypothetical protein [Opitutaceae bacterium]